MPGGDPSHPLPAPTRQVRYVDLRVPNEVKLGLGDDPPAAGSTAALLERSDQVAAQGQGGESVESAGARLGMELTVQDLPGQPLGQGLELLVQGGAGAGVHGAGLGSGGSCTKVYHPAP